MPRLLTKRKQKWADRRKPDVIRGNAINPSATCEMRYYQRLSKLIDRMAADTEKQLRALFDTEHAEEFFAQDASIAAQAKRVTNKLSSKFDAMFAEVSKPLAEQVADMAEANASSQLHTSLQQLTGGLSLGTRTLAGPIKDILSATVTENVGLIKSISAQYLDGVQGAVMRSITTGNGLQDLVPYLAKHKEITLRRARMIARDQTRKANSSISRAKMQQLGLKKFEWLHTSGSAHPRELHIRYSGQIFSFDNPPVIDDKSGERGFPGQAINCRCKFIPVLDFDGDE